MLKKKSAINFSALKLNKRRVDLTIAPKMDTHNGKLSAALLSSEDEFNSPDLLMSRSLTVSKTTLKWTLGMGGVISINAFFKTILPLQ